jgi:hypothetical protein
MAVTRSMGVAAAPWTNTVCPTKRKKSVRSWNMSCWIESNCCGNTSNEYYCRHATPSLECLSGVGGSICVRAKIFRTHQRGKQIQEFQFSINIAAILVSHLFVRYYGNHLTSLVIPSSCQIINMFALCTVTIVFKTHLKINVGQFLVVVGVENYSIN